MSNLPNAIVIVGVLFVLGYFDMTSNTLYVLVSGGVILNAFLTWTYLDSDINDALKKQSVEKGELEIELMKLRKRCMEKTLNKK